MLHENEIEEINILKDLQLQKDEKFYSWKLWFLYIKIYMNAFKLPSSLLSQGFMAPFTGNTEIRPVKWLSC